MPDICWAASIWLQSFVDFCMRHRCRHCWHDCRKRLRRSRQSNGRDGDQSVGLASMLHRVEARSAPGIEHERRLRKAQMHQVFDGTSPPHANGACRGRCRPIVPPKSRACRSTTLEEAQGLGRQGRGASEGRTLAGCSGSDRCVSDKEALDCGPTSTFLEARRQPGRGAWG